MDLLLALNVTIYGLGIVFLALLVLMFSIMVLTKLFSVATGKDLLSGVPATAAQPAPALQMAAAAPVSASAVAEAPAPVAAPAAPVIETAAPAPASQVVEQLFAPLPGKVLSVAVKVGDKVKAGDELCVIEAMKMGNSIKAQKGGVVSEVLVSAGDSVAFGTSLVVLVGEVSTGRAAMPAAPAPAPKAAAAPAAAAASALAGFKLGVAGKQHQVDLKKGPNGSTQVVIDGQSFNVDLDKADSRKIIVNGAAHTVEVKDRGASGALVVVDGVAHKVDISGEKFEAPAKDFKMSIGGTQYQAEIKGSVVFINGSAFQVEQDKADARRYLVNGQPHTVDVKSVVGDIATVIVNGVVQKIQLSGLAAVVPTVAPAPAPAPAAPAPAPAAPIAAPTPAPAPAAPKAPAVSETITAPLPGKIISVAVKAGDAVNKGDELCVIEAMKMGNSIKAQRAGTIADVLVSPGQSVGFGAPLVVVQ